MQKLIAVVACVASCVAGACSTPRGAGPAAPGGGGAEPAYAIVIHGGAGTFPRSAPAERRQAYEEALAAALTIGRDELAKGGTALDACEKVVRYLENDPKFNAGKGAVYTEIGTHELDASIMDGSTLACGAVAGVKTVKNPITLARLVMTNTRHVLLAGDGAEAFADTFTVEQVERVGNSYFDTERQYEVLQEVLEERKKEAEPKPRSTVGCAALDMHGNLAAATSTGGLTGKRFGRIGDSPIIGAGTYADNRTCAVSCTGVGEEFIRHGVARDIAALMEYKGLSVNDAAMQVVFKTLRPDDGGVIAVSRTGEIAMVFSTVGMFRGAADSSGRFEVAIWGD
ncbi:MAG: isoaspartyl peptidase/L-asparaginase [Phycisphaeraceae bacterium]|nr:isoaspartyl peptidase/L-asparaginase [Phycisphaeraceae bacterium]